MEAPVVGLLAQPIVDDSIPASGDSRFSAVFHWWLIT